MGLFKKKKNNISISFTETVNGRTRSVSTSRVENNRFTKDMEHLTKEGELPWGWYSLNKEFTSKIDAEFSYFLNEWVASRNLSPVKQYGALKSFVLYMNDAQKLCYSKGECFAYWFDGVASPEYIEKRTTELKELETNFEQLQAMYERKEKELKGLDKRAINMLKQNDGILQAEFLKMFDASVKNDVSELLYQWSKEGKIDRVKSGRSYILRTKKGQDLA